MYKMGETAVLRFITSNPSTNKAINADSDPTINIYIAASTSGNISPDVTNFGSGLYLTEFPLLGESGFYEQAQVYVIASYAISGVAQAQIVGDFVIDGDGHMPESMDSYLEE